MVRPPTSRSVVPGPGRLGLVEETAPSDLRTLGWTDEDSLELLWSLSRAPNADLALRTLVRLYESLGSGWSEFDTALRTDKGFRGRILGLVGASSALADHLVADDSTWRLLLTKEGQSSGVSAKIELPTKATLVAELLEAVGAEPETGPNAAPDLYRASLIGPPAVIALRKKYRDQIMVLAAYDLAATVENEPVLPYTVVGSQLSDMADAALTAALAVRGHRVPGHPVSDASGRRRNGQMRCTRTQLRLRRRRRVRRRARRLASEPHRR